MSKFFISYDLGDSSARRSDYEKIENYLENQLRAQKILLNLWMYNGSLFGGSNVANIKENLRNFLESTDRLFVVEGTNWDGINWDGDIPPN